MAAMSAPLPPPPAERIREVKERLDGSTMNFSLERWLVREGLVVGRWVAEDDRYAPVGTVSWGVWWRGRPYGAYRIHRPDGSLRGYRVDVIEDVRIAPEEVRYRDLILDAWLSPSGEARFEDEEEVEAAIASGVFDARRARRVRRARAVMERGGARVVARIDAAIAEAVEAVRAG